MSAALQEIVEWRGVEGLVAAEILTDDNETGTGHGYTTGEVFSIAGVAEISKSVDASSEAHYYDNVPAVVIQGNGADTITVSASAIPLDVQAKLTGQYYDEDLGAFVEGETVQKYFAVGYITEKTNGDKVYVWRHKGTFALGDQTNTTKNAGTDANGQELTYTGISTTHKFTKTGKPAKAINVDLGKDLADVSTFFDEVTTIDTLVGKTAYTLTITQASDTTVTVTKNGAAIASGATIHAGDRLQITVTGGTVTVGGVAFTSGDIHVVTGDTAVVSTKT